jgi:Mrp family chromosome partitioning ATPase
LTSGPLPPNPAELVGSKRMKSLLARLQEQADIVILDSPPIEAVVDPIILSTEVDGVLLVVRLGKTRRDTARRALHALQQVNARVLGMALNGAPTNKGDYLYNYKYNSYYKHEQPADSTKVAAPQTAPSYESPIPQSVSLEADDLFEVEPTPAYPPTNGNGVANGNSNGQVIISGRNIFYKGKNGRVGD